MSDPDEGFSDGDVLIPNDGSIQAGDRSGNEIRCCDPSGRIFRFTGLLLMSILGFGSYFCYDGPGALQDNIQKDLHLTTSQFVMLYSWYSWPNVVLCFVGGFLVDRVFGIGLGTCIYAGLVVLGQIIFACGGIFNTFWLMIVGRFIFGIGGESLAVAQNSYAVMWFKGKELNMVFGFQLSFARVGSTVNFLVMESLYSRVNDYYTGYLCTGITLLIASITTFISFACALIMAYMNKKLERSRRENSTNQAEPEVIKLADVKDFPISFWMVCVICVAYYIAIFPFIALGKVFFERKFGLDPNSANSLNSIVYLISGISSPFFGLLVDYTGRNVMWVLISIVASLGAHALLAFTFLQPYIGMVCLGISYSMLAGALWPMIALVIPDHQLGTAYGIAQALQNLGLAVATLLSGLIVDHHGYVMLEVFFLGWLCVSFLAIVVIWIHDSLKGGFLNMSAKERQEFENNRLAVEELEREKLLASGSMSDVTPQDLLHQSSSFIRNRYLARIGAQLPNMDVTRPRGQSFRALR